MTWNRTALLAALPVAAVAVIAGVVSYSHITALGLRTGQSPADAHLLPLAVDGLIVAGSVILLAGSGLGWLGVGPGVAGTLYANIMSGLPRGPLAATIAAWPALAFTVASFMLERWLKAQAAVPEGVPAVPGELNGHAHAAAALFAADIEAGRVPGIRKIRSGLHVGQPKAEQVQAYLRGLVTGTHGSHDHMSAALQPARTPAPAARDARRDP
jgi:Protein of unknown function (DUF2637)